MSDPARSPMPSTSASLIPLDGSHSTVHFDSSLPRTSAMLSAASASLSSHAIRTIRLMSPSGAPLSASVSPVNPPISVPPRVSESPFRLVPPRAESNPSSFAAVFPPRPPDPSLVTLASSPIFQDPLPTANASGLIPPTSQLPFNNTNVVSSTGTPFCLSSFLAPRLSVPGVPAPVDYPGRPASQELLPAPRLDFAPFIVGPGIPPVSAKLVSSIVSGKFVELAALIEEPSDSEAPTFALMDDRLVLRPGKKMKEITNITCWLEAFNVYMLVLTAYRPHRITDLLRYSLLILRTAQQFPGSGWLAYDLAFRKDAAARGRTDWSVLHPELFHFHVSAAQRPPPRRATPASPPHRDQGPSAVASRADSSRSGSRTSDIICRSWNWGRCSSPYPVCRFRHVCDYPQCFGRHRRREAHPVLDRSTSGSSPSRPTKSQVRG